MHFVHGYHAAASPIRPAPWQQGNPAGIMGDEHQRASALLRGVDGRTRPCLIATPSLGSMTDVRLRSDSSMGLHDRSTGRTRRHAAGQGRPSRSHPCYLCGRSRAGSARPGMRHRRWSNRAIVIRAIRPAAAPPKTGSGLLGDGSEASP